MYQPYMSMNKAVIALAITISTFLGTEVNAQKKNLLPCSTAAYKQFDFWVGNICNLACSTCTSFYSSTWNTLLQRPGGYPHKNHRDSKDKYKTCAH